MTNGNFSGVSRVIIIYDIKKINELFEIKETFLGNNGLSDNFFVKMYQLTRREVNLAMIYNKKIPRLALNLSLKKKDRDKDLELQTLFCQRKNKEI